MEAVESRDQLVDVWSRIVGDRGGTVSTEDGVGFLWAGSDFPFWNTLTLTGAGLTPDDLRARLARVADFQRGQEASGFLWLFEDLLDERARHDLPQRARAAGLEVAFEGYGMTADLTLPEPSHPELEFRRVRTEEDLETYGEINALAYEMPPPVGRAALAGSKLWREEAYAYLGHRDGEPVTCAAALGGRDSMFVALVATVPGQQGRGFGEAVTRQAIFKGFHHTGHRHVVLHATQAGRPVYERIGFRADSRILFLQPAGTYDEIGD